MGKEKSKDDKVFDDKKLIDLNKKINRLKREAKPKLVILKKRKHFEKPSEMKKERLASAQRRTKTQQREE